AHGCGHEGGASRTQCSSTARSFVILCHRSRSRCRRCAPPGKAPAARDSDCTQSLLDFVLMIPHCPRRTTSAEDVLKVLLFLEGVHAGPIAVMRVGHQLAFVNEALKRLFNQLFPI